MGLAREYRRSRRDLRSLSKASAQTALYILDDLAAWLDGAPTAGPARRRTSPIPVYPHAPASAIVQAVEGWVGAHHWSPATIGTNLGMARPFLEWAAARGACTGGVASQLKNPRKPKPIPRALPDRSVEALLAVVPDARGRAMVLLMAQCGLRRAEVASLWWPSDIDMVEGNVLVHGKGGMERVVWASDETLDALRLWFRERGARPGPLFTRYRTGRAGSISPNQPMTPVWVGALVKTWLEAAGLKSMPRDGVSAHALRHSAATRLLRDGANIRVVQQALGHQNMSTTARYLRVEDPEVRAAMQAVSYSRRLRAVAGESTTP